MINNVTLDGRVGKDPVCGESSSGTKYAQFSIAHNVYDRGKQSTYWIRCVAFGKMADTIEDYVLKGMAVVVAGDLRISPGREGSQEVGVIVKQLQMQSKPKSTRPEPEKKEGDPFEDDIPF